MTLEQACLQEGMTKQNFFYYVNNYPELKEKYEAVRTAKREITGSLAENNLHNALEDNSEIGMLDKARLSLDYLKATDKSYNQKIEVNQTVKALNFNVSDEEVLARINELMSKI